MTKNWILRSVVVSGLTSGMALTGCDLVSDLTGRGPDVAVIINVGCADGEREGFVDTGYYPDIAGCSGAWSIPGVSLMAPAEAPACPGLVAHDTRSPACEGTGDDSVANPTGDGCNVADLCAPGWHVCLDAGEVAGASGTACNGAVQPEDPALLFLTRQSSNGCDECATGTRIDPDCDSLSCTAGCLQTEHVSNNVYGCGNYGAVPGESCSPLDRSSENLCAAIADRGWSCDDAGPADDSGACESFTIVHSDPATGGVLCCRNGSSSDSDGDGVPDEADNCIGVPNPEQGDRDGDGFGDPCDSDPGCTDSDGDGACDEEDNCPGLTNPDQADADDDQIGDACDDSDGDACDDSDGDSVYDDVDLCPDTVMPEAVPTRRLRVNRWALTDDSGVFQTGRPGDGECERDDDFTSRTSRPDDDDECGCDDFTGQNTRPDDDDCERDDDVTVRTSRPRHGGYTIESTGGCSCEQIIEALHLGNGHTKHGCSNGVMRNWTEMVASGSAS